MGAKEAAVEKHLVRMVKKFGGITRKYVSPGVRGVPDRIVFLNGVYFVEVKAPGKRVPEYQKREHIRMRKQGAKVYVFSTRAQVNRWVEMWGND